MTNPSGEGDAPRNSTRKSGTSAAEGEQKLQLFAEDLSIRKENVETGRVRVARRTHTRQAEIDEQLLREDAVVETIPRGHQLSEMPVTRVEGDTTIIPVVEEVLYTEKRLILKEEIHITRRRTTERFHDTVTLRRQEALFSRLQSATEQSGQTPEDGLKNTEE